jgi:hypothetical protein
VHYFHLKNKFIFNAQSCFGHTEGVAGITGTLLAYYQLAQRLSTPVVNLRSMNPYVEGTLGDWKGGKGRGAVIQRLNAPISWASETPIASTSSFGMSGVNAHALIKLAGDTQLTVRNKVSAWERESCWPHPVPHQYLRKVTFVSVAAVDIQLGVDLTCAAWLKDHIVRGSILMPGAAMIECVIAAVQSMDAGTNRLFTGLTIKSPLVLEDGPTSRPSSCRMELASGSLYLMTGNTEHMVGRSSVYMEPQHAGVVNQARVLQKLIPLVAKDYFQPHSMASTSSRPLAKNIEAGR